MKETDEALYKKLAVRNEKALEMLYDRYEKLVFSFALRFVNHNKMLAEEIVQDVFMKIWNKKQGYDAKKGKFSSWILTITRNSAIDQLRKQKKTEYTWDERDTLKDIAPSTEEQVEWQEEKEKIQAAIKQLSLPQQEIIELFYFKGMAHAEIAKTCNIPLGTVKGRVRLALKHLNDMFISEGQKGGHQDD